MSASVMLILEVILVKQLLFRAIPPDLALQVIQGQMLRVQPLLEFLLGERRLDLVQPVRNFLIGRHQVLLAGALHHDFFIDQLAHEVVVGL